MPRNYTRRTRGGKRRKRGGKDRGVYRSVDAFTGKGTEVKCLVPHALANKDFDDALRIAIKKLEIAEKKIDTIKGPTPNPIAATGVRGVPAVTKPVVMAAVSAAPKNTTGIYPGFYRNEDSRVVKATGGVLASGNETAAAAADLATATGKKALDTVTTIAKNTTDGAKSTAKGVLDKMKEFFTRTRRNLNATPVTTQNLAAAGGGRRRRRRFRRGTKSRTHSGKDFETRKKSKRYRRKSFKRRFGRVTARAPLFPFVGGRRTRRRRGGRSKRRRR